MSIAADVGAVGAPAARNPAAFSRDFVASIVVFLVAIPLCMGIAVASGVPPEKGLITGVIGGLVVGAIAGSPLQVSGPAAGLAVIVFDIVQKQGLSALGPILLIAGAVQIAAGVLRLGQWFRAISPAVVHGMLAGIGALIVLGQLHVLLDRSPMANGVQNLMAIPGAFISLSPLTVGQAEAAFVIGASTIFVIWAWERFRPAKLKLIPGALLGVLVGSGIAAIFALDVKKVTVPESLLGALSFPEFGRLGEPAILMSAVVIGFIASCETLLSAAAVDRMHDGPRTKYNKELVAQGVGNGLCGLLGGLPMTGVIVRSSANVQAGAVTRLSTMLHGAWILGLVALLPFVLEQIPMAALAGVLVVTGWKLVSLKHVRHLFHQYGLLPAIVWAGTFVMVVATDLLMGVLVGLALSLLELIPLLRKPRLAIQQRAVEDQAEVELSGAATFLQLPRITHALESLPAGKPVRLVLKGLSHIDHTSAEMIADWLERRRAAGGRIELDPHGAARHQRFAVAAGG